MDSVWAALFLALLTAVQFLHVFGLPANWVALTLLAVWKWLHPAQPDGLTWLFVGFLLALALAGEAAEFAAQAHGARKYGASTKGNVAGMIGAIAGAILGAPFFLGLGALLGSLAGAFLGCLVLELIQGRSFGESRRAALGAFFGKALGTTIKMSLGAVMVILSVPRVWP